MNESEQKKYYMRYIRNDDPMKRCMNCERYNWAYGYCDNKESDYYQLEVRYDESCEFWIR